MRERASSYSARRKETSWKSVETVETDSVIQVFPVRVLRLIAIQRDVRFGLIDSHSARCSPVKAEMERIVAVELIFSGIMKPERQAQPPL